MTREQAIQLARVAIMGNPGGHSYAPTNETVADWQPHAWVIDAIQAAVGLGNTGLRNEDNSIPMGDMDAAIVFTGDGSMEIHIPKESLLDTKNRGRVPDHVIMVGAIVADLSKGEASKLHEVFDDFCDQMQAQAEANRGA